MLAQGTQTASSSRMLTIIAEFKNLSSAELEGVNAKCRWRNYQANEPVIRYGDETKEIFFIVHGAIRITYYSLDGHEVILNDLLVGETFGELSAIDGQTRSATAVAKVGSLVVSMSAPAFLDLVYSNKHVSNAILRRLTGHVRRLTDRVFDFSTLPVRSRIHGELLRLAIGRMVSPNSATISPAPTHTEIANRISTHREAVTRELNNLVRTKVIRREKHDLIILDVEKLRRLVHEVRGSLR